MSIPTAAITVRHFGADGQPIAGALVTAALSKTAIYQGVVVPRTVSGVTDAAGVCTLDLFPNGLSQVYTYYTVRLSKTGLSSQTLRAYIPDATAGYLDAKLISDGAAPANITSPVTKVNGRMGDVVINRSDISAAYGVIHVPAITSIDISGMPDGQVIFAAGRSTALDGAGGELVYSAASSQAADGVTVYAPAGGGRLFRKGWTVFGFVGTLMASWAGASAQAADNTAALQSCVEALPSSGGRIELDQGTYGLSHLRLDGTNSNKSDVALVGKSAGLTKLRKLDNSAITGDEAKRQSVVYWFSGHRFRVQDLTVEGNWSRGGASPPIALNHTLGNTWPGAGKIRSCALDGTTGSKFSATDRILKVTALGAGQVSSLVNVSFDIAAGYVEDVTSQPWSYTTQTGYNNAFGADDEFAWGHGVYGNGLSEPTETCEILNVHVTDCRHGGVMVGSGPLYASQKGYGATRALIQGCHAFNNQGSNFGGGFSTFRRLTVCSALGGTSSGIRLDEGCHSSTLTGCIVDGGGDADNGGINLFESNDCALNGCTVVNAAAGVWINSCNGCSISGGSINNAFGAGLTVYNSQNTTVTAVGIEGAAGYGIKWVTSKLGSITSCVVKNSGGSGIYIQGSNSCTVTGNQSIGNGISGDANNAGIELLDADNNIVIGNKCIEPNGGSGTQNYGINERGTSIGNFFAFNSCSLNKVAQKVILPTSYDILNPTTSGIGSLAGLSVSGALIQKNGTSGVPNNTPTTISFGPETYDTAAIHDPSVGNTRVTVPPGITSIKLATSVVFDPANTTGKRRIRFLKNGASYLGQSELTVLASTTTVLGLQSPELIVTAGDFFEVEGWQDAGVAVNVMNDDRTWLSMSLK